MGFLSRFFYNLGLVLAVVLLSPVWVLYLSCVAKTRAGFVQKLGFYPEDLRARLTQKIRPRLWFHAVSVGEFNAIKTLIPHLSEAYEIVISTTTRTGQDLACRTFPSHMVLYFPYDFWGSVSAALRQIQPDLVILTETELWPNFVHQVSRVRQTPILLINGRLSQRSYRKYQWIQPFIKPCLQEITHLYMQSQADADRMIALGQLASDQWTVAGNLKFDLIPTVEAPRRSQLAYILNIAPQDAVLTLASTHSGEDALLVASYLRLKKDFPELKLILAPRHPERLAEIKGILNAQTVGYSVRSQLSDNHPNQQDIVVLDSIGELLTVYSLSRIAVMGGSFVERGGQNPLEPLSQGVPVIFGPHMHNFSEITRLILDAEAGYQVSNAEDLNNSVTALLTQPEIYEMVSEKGLQLIENNRGAKAVILRAIETHLPPKSSKSLAE